MSHRIIRRRSRGGRNGALLLIALGLLFFVAPAIAGALSGLLWPLFVLVPGLLLFGAVRRGGAGRAWLTVPASMISMTGLLLLYQTLTGHWASWAYAWSLIMPGAFGMGLAVYGDLTRRSGLADTGQRIAKGGAGLFVMGFLFFELLLNMSGLTSLIVPVAFVALGLYLLRRCRGRARRGALDGPGARSLGDGSTYIETPVYPERERV